MKYRKETVKSPVGGGVHYYPIQRDVLNLRDIARRIESAKNLSSIDTMRIVWTFLEEIVPLLLEGDKIVITDYCSLAATIKKGDDGKPKIGGIQLHPSGMLKKAIAKASLKECLNTDETVK